MIGTLSNMLRIALSASGLAEYVPCSCLAIELAGQWLHAILYKSKVLLLGASTKSGVEWP